MDAPPVEPRFLAAAEALSCAVGDAVNPQFLAAEDEVVRRLCDLARLPGPPAAPCRIMPCSWFWAYAPRARAVAHLMRC